MMDQANVWVIEKKVDRDLVENRLRNRFSQLGRQNRARIAQVNALRKLFLVQA